MPWRVISDPELRHRADEAVMEQALERGKQAWDMEESFATPLLAKAIMGMDVGGFWKQEWAKGWKASDQLSYYRTKDPIWLVTQEQVDAWALTWSQGDAAMSLPVELIGMLIQPLVAYYSQYVSQTNDIRCQPDPVQAQGIPMVMGKQGQLEEQDPNQAQMARQQYAMQAQQYQADMQAWSMRMERIGVGGVRVGDLLTPFWWRLWRESVPETEKHLRRYMRLLDNEAKRYDDKMLEQYAGGDGVGML